MSLPVVEVSMKEKQWMILFSWHFAEEEVKSLRSVQSVVFIIRCKKTPNKPVVPYQFLRFGVFARCLPERMKETPKEQSPGEDSIGTRCHLSYTLLTKWNCSCSSGLTFTWMKIDTKHCGFVQHRLLYFKTSVHYAHFHIIIPGYGCWLIHWKLFWPSLFLSWETAATSEF